MSTRFIKVVCTNYGDEYHNSMIANGYCTTNPWVEYTNGLFQAAVNISFPDDPDIKTKVPHVAFKGIDMTISHKGRLIHQDYLPRSGYPRGDIKGREGHWRDLLTYILRYKNVKITGTTCSMLMEQDENIGLVPTVQNCIEIISDKSYTGICGTCKEWHKYPPPLDRYSSIEDTDPMFLGMTVYIDRIYVLLDLPWTTVGSQGYSDTFFDKHVTESQVAT